MLMMKMNSGENENDNVFDHDTYYDSNIEERRICEVRTGGARVYRLAFRAVFDPDAYFDTNNEFLDECSDEQTMTVKTPTILMNMAMVLMRCWVATTMMLKAMLLFHFRLTFLDAPRLPDAVHGLGRTADLRSENRWCESL
jgi:hypothetical protein